MRGQKVSSKKSNLETKKAQEDGKKEVFLILEAGNIYPH